VFPKLPGRSRRPAGADQLVAPNPTGHASPVPPSPQYPPGFFESTAVVVLRVVEGPASAISVVMAPKAAAGQDLLELVARPERQVALPVAYQ